MAVVDAGLCTRFNIAATKPFPISRVIKFRSLNAQLKFSAETFNVPLPERSAGGVDRRDICEMGSYFETS